MKVETVRFVSDRYEWASMTLRAPSVYHRWEWSEQSRRRVAHLNPHLTVDIAYLRVWDGDTLVACPVLMIDDVWYNSPRATPLVLDGGPADASRIIAYAVDDNVDLVLIDDAEQTEALEALRWELNADADDYRRRRSIIPTDLHAMRARLSFESEDVCVIWFDGIEWAYRSGLDVTLTEYRRNDEPIGWELTVEHLGEPTVLAAAHVDRLVEAWTSLR